MVDDKHFLCTFIVYSVLQYMFIPALALLQPSEEQICPHGDYPTEKGICCNKCSPGKKTHMTHSGVPIIGIMIQAAVFFYY